MNTSGFRACVKELYETRYDPLSVSYAVLTGQLIPMYDNLMKERTSERTNERTNERMDGWMDGWMFFDNFIMNE